ncbi:MAG TPA: carboxypeptidase-like regulatory domain-containing protein, partial [Marmoricola sp.]
MKAFTSRSALGRRVAATAVLGLAAASLTLGLAGPASADVTISDLSGTVTDSNGAPADDVHVEVYDATDGTSLDSMHTDAAGHYDFTDLEFDGNVKVEFYDHSFTYGDPVFYLDRWYGGSKYESGATPVA